MKLYEHEAKTIFANYGIPTPKGQIVATSQQAQEAAEKLADSVVIKAQVLVAGRGKAGGILFAETVKEAEESAQKLLETKIKDITVKSILVEEKVSIKKELYFGITVDRLNRCFVMAASQTGGIDIEEVAKHQPDKILKQNIDAQLGFRIFNARQIADKLGYKNEQLIALSDIFEKMYQIGVDFDAELIEMNPLVETLDGKFVAVDVRIIIDDNALFRHSDYAKLRLAEPRDLEPMEFDALRSGLEYVKLDGDIGIAGNGAGLVMATLDLITYFGGKAANFLDMGGGAPPERIETAFKIILSNPQVKVLFVNILGGITLCDEVARGVIQAREQLKTTKPLVVRLVGTNEAEGKRILCEAGLQTFSSMEEAAKRAVELARGEE